MDSSLTSFRPEEVSALGFGLLEAMRQSVTPPPETEPRVQELWDRVHKTLVTQGAVPAKREEISSEWFLLKESVILNYFQEHVLHHSWVNEGAIKGRRESILDAAKAIGIPDTFALTYTTQYVETRAAMEQKTPSRGWKVMPDVLFLHITNIYKKHVHTPQNRIVLLYYLIVQTNLARRMNVDYPTPESKSEATTPLIEGLAHLFFISPFLQEVEGLVRPR